MYAAGNLAPQLRRTKRMENLYRGCYDAGHRCCGKRGRAIALENISQLVLYSHLKLGRPACAHRQSVNHQPFDVKRHVWLPAAAIVLGSKFVG